MKSRMIMALLLVFSAGLVQPLHADECVVATPQGFDLGAKGTPIYSGDDGSGETGETLGDPDGWLGGQNFRPPPPVEDDETLDEASDGTGGLIATVLALLQLFMIL